MRSAQLARRKSYTNPDTDCGNVSLVDDWYRIRGRLWRGGNIIEEGGREHQPSTTKKHCSTQKSHTGASMKVKDGTVWVEGEAGCLSGSESTTHVSFRATAGPTEDATPYLFCDYVLLILYKYQMLLNDIHVNLPFYMSVLRQRNITSVLQSFLCFIDSNMDNTVHRARRKDPNWSLSINQLMAFIFCLPERWCPHSVPWLTAGL